MTAEAARTIFAYADPVDVAEHRDHGAATFADSFPEVTARMREAKTDVLPFTEFPVGHCPACSWIPAAGDLSVIDRGAMRSRS